MDGWLKKAERIIDLGADFRLGSAEAWKAWYGTDHAAPHLLSEFVPRHSRALRRRDPPGDAASPARAARRSFRILCLYPLVKHGLISPGPIIIDAKMGSSQAGHTPSDSSHHPERAGVVRSYKPTGHRHAAEIERALAGFGGRPSGSRSRPRPSRWSGGSW